MTPSELRDRIRAILPRTIEVRTGAQQAATETSELESNLSFLRTFLLVFAYVALVVGAFIIFNTFSITVAQRTREFGLLRTLGASRRQIMQSVGFEGLLLGAGGAVVGLLGGVALAPALDQLFKAFGADLPDSGTVLETRTIVVSLLVGMSVTVLAGLSPALRATRVPPLAAMREGVRDRTAASRPRRRAHRGAVLAGALAVGLGALSGSAAVSRSLLVALAVYVTLLLVPPRACGRCARAIACVVALGSRDRGARKLARRHRARRAREHDPPARSHDGYRGGADRRPGARDVRGGPRRRYEGDDQPGGRPLVRGQPDRGELQASTEAGIPALVAPALRRVPGVASVTPIAFTLGELHGISGNASITAIEPSTFVRVLQSGMGAGLKCHAAGARQQRHGC